MVLLRFPRRQHSPFQHLDDFEVGAAGRVVPKDPTALATRTEKLIGDVVARDIPDAQVYLSAT
jgi:hypothetical protein